MLKLTDPYTEVGQRKKPFWREHEEEQPRKTAAWESARSICSDAEQQKHSATVSQVGLSSI